MMYLLAIALAIFVSNNAVPAQTSCGDNDYKCKIALYSKQIVDDPNNDEAYYNRALAYRNSNNCDAAIRDLTRYLSSATMKPADKADGYDERGICYKTGGDLASAIADYNMAIKILPSHTASYINRGNIYDLRQDYPSAVADYTKAVQLDPKEAEAFYNRARVYNKQKLYTKAVADYDRYIELNTDDKEYLADGYHNRGLIYEILGNYDHAVKDLTSSIDLDPADPTAYKARASVYRKMGKTALAAADEQRAAALKP
jgi:tetratricopeptide (TPR) repeat protein